MIERGTKNFGRYVRMTRCVYCSESVDAAWRSFEQIPKPVDEVVTADGVELKNIAKGNRIMSKLLSFKFLFTLHFMRLITKKTDVLTQSSCRKNSVFWTCCC